MDATQAIRIALNTAEMIALAYLEDLSDEDLMLRPVPGSNHVNWQLGHLICSENRMVGLCFPDRIPALPVDLAPRYGKDQAVVDDAARFETKTGLMQQYRIQRDATLAALEAIDHPSQLDVETDESIRPYAPDVGSALIMQSTHWMMHAGQWAVLRRKLGRKPIF